MTYEGEILNGEAHGFGTLTKLDGYKYIGTWEHDKQDGKGEEYWPDNDVFIGHFVIGKKHGFGKFKYFNGTWYEGEFKQGNMKGWGTY